MKTQAVNCYAELVEALQLIIGHAGAGKLSNELGKHIKLGQIIGVAQHAIAKAERERGA